jgi:hypothetical protein
METSFVGLAATVAAYGIVICSGYGRAMDVETARATIVAEPPRRLRLDELLRELGANDGVPPLHPCDGERPPRPRRDALTVGALVDKAEEGGFAFLIGVLTLIAIPFVGVSTPFGLAIALLGVQLMVGRRRPWLPARARRRAVSMTMLDRVLGILTRRTRWLAKLSRRRWESAIQPQLIGLCIVLLALGLALPLPIPGSNLMFLIPLFIYAVGVLERDGLWIVLGYASTLVEIALLVVFGATVTAVFARIWHWLT